MKPKKPSYRLHELQLENFMRVRGVHIMAKGRHVIISAKNGIGKTSTLDAIWIGLTGPHSSDIPEPIHRGSKRAEIIIELRSEYATEPRLEKIIIERVFREGGKSTITATAADGSLIKSPMELFEGMMAKYAMNPVEFLGKRPQDQLDDYLMVGGVKHPFDEVQEITGEEFPLINPKESCYSWLSRLSADDTGVFYVRRRNCGRLLEEAKAAAKKQEEHLRSLPEEGTEPALDDLLQAQADITAKSDHHRQTKAIYETAKRDRLHAERSWEQVNREMEESGKRKDELKRLLAEETAKYERLTTKVVVAHESLKEYQTGEKEALAALNEAPDQTADLIRIRDRIKAAGQNQEQVIKRKAAEERLAELNKEVARRDQDHSELEQMLHRLRELRKKIIEGIDLGVPGLSVGEGTLLYNGIDFKQANLAKGLEVACAIVMRQKAGIKLLRIDNAEHLDDDSTNLVLDMADKYDWQVIMTRVDSSNNNLNISFTEAETDSE
jgi:hypothetical protein